MFEIRNNNDAKTAYTLIRRRDVQKSFSDGLKRAVRRFMNKPEYGWAVVKCEDERCIYKNYLPDDLKTKADAEQYFDEYERITPYPSAYDCTGQKFTSWYSVFRVNNKWLCYHCVGLDV